MLRARRACEPQLQLFQQTFGDSVELTEELAQKYGHLFNTHWAAVRFLSEENQRVYFTEEEAAWEIYDAAKKTARKFYCATKIPPPELYYAVIKAAYEVLTAANDAAREAFQQSRALTFVRLYNAQMEG